MMPNGGVPVVMQNGVPQMMVVCQVNENGMAVPVSGQMIPGSMNGMQVVQMPPGAQMIPVQGQPGQLIQAGQPGMQAVQQPDPAPAQQPTAASNRDVPAKARPGGFRLGNAKIAKQVKA